MNIIPNEATITLPAKKYYETITSLIDAENAKNLYLEGIEVDSSSVETPKVILPQNPFADEIVGRVVELIIDKSDIMIVLARKEEHYFDPTGAGYFTSYGWGSAYDLCDDPKFAAAWTLAKTILEQEDDDE